MPLDGPDLWGSEKDGSPNHEYCKYCYQNGSFINPNMALAEMRLNIMHRMEKEKIPFDTIEAAVNRLPFLKRWRTNLPKET